MGLVAMRRLSYLKFNSRRQSCYPAGCSHSRRPSGAAAPRRWVWYVGIVSMQSPVLSQEEELYWLALRLVPGLGPRTSGKLLERFRTPQAIFRSSRSELEGAGVSGATAQSIAS